MNIHTKHTQVRKTQTYSTRHTHVNTNHTHVSISYYVPDELRWVRLCICARAARALALRAGVLAGWRETHTLVQAGG